MNVLRVYPNPWAATDKHGVPCGVCPRDPESDGGAPGQYVGARVDKKRTQVLQDFGEHAAHELRSPMQRTCYEYLGVASDDPELGTKLLSKEPVELPRSKYYRDRIADGSLLCADKATADAAKFRGFVPIEQLSKRFVAAPAPPATPTVEAEAIDSPAPKKPKKPSDLEVTQ
jgi:hypothetical protein